jgi:hypothetical protein
VHRGELGVHHKDAVGADRDGDVAAGAFEHVGLVAEVRDLDLIYPGTGLLNFLDRSVASDLVATVLV